MLGTDAWLDNLVEGSLPRFSIALPVRNGEEFLDVALESVLSQSFEDFELVIGDNASTDDTPGICAAFAQRDGRVRVHRSEEPLTQSQNVNRTMRLCRGEWIKILCHDDVLRPQCLASVDAAIRQHGGPRTALVSNAEAWLFRNGYLFDPSAGGTGEVRSWTGVRYLEALFAGRVPNALPSLTTATVLRGAWIAGEGFDERYAVAGDTYLWQQLLLDWDYLVLDEVLTVNRIHSGQVAVAQRGENRRQLETCRRFYREFFAESRGKLNIGVRGYVRGRCRYVAVAGANVAISLLRRQFRGAIVTIRGTPPIALPLLPAFVIKSLRQERRKLKQIRPMVELSDIYPG